MNTGFGGSADTRTRQVGELQRTLIRELHCGIITPPLQGDPDASGLAVREERKTENADANGLDPEIHSPPWQNNALHAAPVGEHEKSPNDLISKLKDALPADDQSTSMPEVWVRASILVRINSLASARSGVRPVLIATMADLLGHDILPRVPLRGSISASGDLIPLSYIAGTMLGKPTLIVSAGSRKAGKRGVTTADVALAEASINPVRLGPKEGLAIVNGTSVSAAVGALAMHDAHGLAALSQVLTAMSVEALCGTSESFDPFFAKVRPHPGQIDAGHNIHRFLDGSRLIKDPDGTEEGSLRQDRYSIRTASQWIGPILEDLLLAHQQVTIECNSVTDNPLTDGKRMLHGGNFQAKAITSAMEKTRLALQSIGRMLFTQCTELINPSKHISRSTTSQCAHGANIKLLETNRGLPPNLVAEEPSSSWLLKGIDIMIAALQSELGFLANPVGTHVQTAEMGNQSLNSLALISARYCHMALDVLSQLAGGHLFALCQALDLRAIHIKFLVAFQPVFCDITQEILTPLLKGKSSLDSLLTVLWSKLTKTLDEVTTMNSTQRFDFAVTCLQPLILCSLSSSEKTIPSLETWTKRCRESMLQTFETNLELYSVHPDASPYLGKAGRRMYTFVRCTLAVPFLRAHHYRSPDPGSDLLNFENQGAFSISAIERDNMTVGSYVTNIYIAIRNGSLYVPVMESLREAQQIEEVAKPVGTKTSKPGKVVDSLVSETKISV